MTITEFLDVVREATRRGTSLDSAAANAFRQAVRFIEQNYNLPYMRRTVTTSVTGGELEITGSDAKYLKSIQRVRWQNDDGEWNWIEQVDPDQVISTDGDYPTGYLYFESTTTAGDKTITLQFDAEFDEATDVEVIAYFYTELDLTNPSVQNIWLINNAEAALLDRTMIALAPVMRDMQLLQLYTQLWEMDMKTLLGAVDALEQGAR